jgi:two-component system CheB/CheR fusion protein
MLASLEHELHSTRDQLQDVLEHAETSDEELKASNEELQAMNEELRAASEELVASKEELQAVNAELVAVNRALQDKIGETGKSNDDLQNLIAANDIATIFVDRTMRIKRYTPRAADIFSIRPGDVGRSLHDITHNLDYDELAADAAGSFRTLRLVEREVGSDSGQFYIARFVPYRTMQDRIEGAILTFIDITGRRRAEERLRAGELRMRLVAESTRDYAIITTDPVGLITSFNIGAARLFGYTEAELLGQDIAIIFTPADRADGVPDSERRTAREQGRAEDERWHLRKDGSTFYCSGVMTPLRSGEFFGYAKIGRDLTGRLQAEQQRSAQLDDEQRRRAEAQAANAMKDEFLAIMSHELKHPLNVISMHADLLLRQPEIGQQPGCTRALAAIQAAVHSQSKIINDLLDLSRLNTGKLTLALAEVDLAALLARLVEVAQAGCGGRRLALQAATGAGGAPQLLIRADADRIEQVLQNLIGNAIKFTAEDGHIGLQLATETVDGQPYARLDVRDDGAGIEAQFLPQVFDMFGQGAASTARAAGGLGIGLALGRQIIDLHHGRIAAQSGGAGLGACFTVWLPLQMPLLLAAPPAAATALAGPARPLALVAPTAALAAPVPAAPLQGVRILLIDDSPDTLEPFCMLLQMAGAEVDAISNARAALRRLGERQFDVVLSDIGMPDMDGYTFLRQLRQQPGYAAVPAIAVTGFGRAQDIALARQAGFDAHLCKPIDIDTVLSLIGTLLR